LRPPAHRGRGSLTGASDRALWCEPGDSGVGNRYVHSLPGAVHGPAVGQHSEGLPAGGSVRRAQWLIPGLPDKALRGSDGQGLAWMSGTNVSGNPSLTGSSWRPEPVTGFRPVLRGAMFLPAGWISRVLIGAWNILPHFSWAHDVTGTSPGPGVIRAGRFAENAGGVGDLQAEERSSPWTTRLRGCRPIHLLNDRDHFGRASILVLMGASHATHGIPRGIPRIDVSGECPRRRRGECLRESFRGAFWRGYR